MRAADSLGSLGTRHTRMDRYILDMAAERAQAQQVPHGQEVHE